VSSASEFPASVRLFGIGTFAIVVAMLVPSLRIYEVFVDPLTAGRRWIILDKDFKLLLSLLLLAAVLVTMLYRSYFRAKIDAEARANPLPAAWKAVAGAIEEEEERDGKVVQRYPKFFSTFAVKAFATQCMKEGVILNVLVFGRHKNLVLFATLKNTAFFIGEIDDGDKVSCSHQFSKLSDAIEAFLSRAAEYR
jgi:hypothetical protein